MARNDTKRTTQISETLRSYAPLIPWADAEPVRNAARQKRYAAFPPKISVWLCLIAHIRHVHTEYDTFLDQGMDQDSARYFVLDDINECLANWGASRQVTLEEE